MSLAPGTTIGRFQIMEPLGQGGMAAVYKAFQPSLQREVALKVLRPGFAQDPEFRERFEREAIAIARLRHPHIVQVFDFEIGAGGEYALAMEFLEGGTLKERMTRLAHQGERIAPAEAVRIVSEVADALAYAHDKGIVHRDVKPSNVMLGRRDWVVVTDFGIARILDATAYTQTGVGIGTPEYMAPEQGLGQHVDHRADIYALGVMAYELLVGRLPYRADTPMGVVLAHIKDPLPLPSQVDPTVGPGVERALLRALAKDPAARFDTTTAFGDALRAGLAADEDARGGSAVTRTAVRSGGAAAGAPVAGRLANVDRRIVFGATAGAAALVLAGGAFVGGAFRAPPPSVAPSTAPPAAAVISATASPTLSPATTTVAPSPTTPAPTAAATAPTLAPTAVATAAPTRVATAPPPAPLPTPAPTAAPTPRSTPSVYELGQAAVLTWEGFETNELEVVVLQVVDPAEPTDPSDAVDPSERLVAVRMTIRNNGPEVYDDYPTDLAEILDGQGRQYQPYDSDPVEPGFGHLRIAAGVRIEGYISFALPKTVRVSAVLFASDPFAGDVARWRVP